MVIAKLQPWASISERLRRSAQTEPLLSPRNFLRITLATQLSPRRLSTTSPRTLQTQQYRSSSPSTDRAHRDRLFPSVENTWRVFHRPNLKRTAIRRERDDRDHGSVDTPAPDRHP